MSTFNLKLETGEFNPKWYKTNSDNVTPRCPANWKLEELTEFARYQNIEEQWYLLMDFGETATLPFKTNDISNLNTKNITMKHFAIDVVTAYTIIVFFNDVDFEVLYFPESYIEYETIIEVPSNAEYIRFEGAENLELWLDVDIQFDFNTANYDINTEQNDTSISPNIAVSTTLSNKVTSRKTSKTDVSYANKLILTNEDEKDIDSIQDLARLNRIQLSVNIDINEAAGNSVANIASGGESNIVKYFFENYGRTQKTGIYSYLDLKYRKDVNSNAIYF